MQNANGPDLAPARHQFSDADQRPGDVVDSYEATPRARGRDNLGRLAVGEDRRAVPLRPNNPPSCQPRFGRRPPGPRTPSSFHQLAPDPGAPKIEGPAPTPDEPLARPAETQNSTDVGREDPDVRSLAADDAQHRARAGDILDEDRTDDHLAGRSLHLETGPGQLVEPPPFVMNRRVHRRHLLDPADERATGLREGRGREISDRGLRQHAAAHVVGVRRQSEADRREVLLVLVDEIGRELRRLPDEDRQHAGRVGIERARVPDTTDAQTATNNRDDIERGRAAPLVDDEDAGPPAHDTRLPSTARRTAASTTRVASGIGPITVQPAA